MAELALATVSYGKFIEFKVNNIGSTAEMKEPMAIIAKPITEMEVVCPIMMDDKLVPVKAKIKISFLFTTWPILPQKSPMMAKARLNIGPEISP